MIKSSYLLTTVTGIPIRIHITLIIVLICMIPFMGVFGLLYSAALFASIALHELGHSWVAIRKGCKVREILLLPIGGVAKMDNIPSRPADEFLVAAAGPLTSLLLAVLFNWLGQSVFLFLSLRNVNLMLCFFNLLPVFPMDGGRIFRAFMTPKMGRLGATALAAKIGKRMAIAFGIIGIFGIPNLLHPNPMLIAIAVFVYFSAGAEYRAVYMQQMSQDWFTVGQQDADVEVSPPPYARRTPAARELWKNKTGALLNSLFRRRR